MNGFFLFQGLKLFCCTRTKCSVCWSLHAPKPECTHKSQVECLRDKQYLSESLQTTIVDKWQHNATTQELSSHDKSGTMAINCASSLLNDMPQDRQSAIRYIQYSAMLQTHLVAHRLTYDRARRLQSDLQRRKETTGPCIISSDNKRYSSNTGASTIFPRNFRKAKPWEPGRHLQNIA